MKRCPMCGSAAIDDAAICFECLYSFERMSCAAMVNPIPDRVERVSRSDSFDVLVDDPERGTATYLLSDEPLQIGRRPTNDIVFSDPMVSRCHMRLFLEQGQVWAETLGAKNSPRINGEPFSGTVRVSPRDVIQVRQATIRVTSHSHNADDTTCRSALGCGGQPASIRLSLASSAAPWP